MTTTTRPYAEGFVGECARHGLNAKQASVLLWRQRMDEILERPTFGKAFMGVLKEAGTKPGLLEQMDASLADQGGLGANVKHYGGKGAITGALGGLGLAGLSLLAKRRSLAPALSAAERAMASAGGLKRKLLTHPVQWGKGEAVKHWLGRPMAMAGIGGVGGGAAGMGYGAKKYNDNNLDVPIEAFSMFPQRQVPSQAPTSTGQRDPYSYTGSVIAGTKGPELAGPPASLANTSASDWVRSQNSQLKDYDAQMAALNAQRGQAGQVGSASGEYAMRAGIDQQLANLQQMRNLKQQQIKDSLRNLQVQQQHLDSTIARTMPGVTDFGLDQQRRGEASQAARGMNSTARKFLQWVGGQPAEYDPTQEYMRRVDSSKAVQRHMEDLKAHPPLYRQL